MHCQLNWVQNQLAIPLQAHPHNMLNGLTHSSHLCSTLLSTLLGVSRAAKLCGCLSIHVIASVRVCPLSRTLYPLLPLSLSV